MNETRSRQDPAGVAHDLDEDLFDFASVARGSGAHAAEREGLEGDDEDLDQVLTSFRDEQAEQEAARAAALPGARDSHVTRRPSPVREPDEGSRVRPSEPVRARQEPRAPLPAAPLQGPASRPRRPSALAAVVLAVTVLNSALAVVVMRPAAPGENRLDEREPAPSPAALQAVPPAATLSAGAHPSLEEAWAEVARGEYASARQRAYGLLALIDGIEGAERAEIEADCRYLIAQALYLDALARREGSP